MRNSDRSIDLMVPFHRGALAGCAGSRLTSLRKNNTRNASIDGVNETVHAIGSVPLARDQLERVEQCFAG
jgi:hypothetical protein